MNSPAPEITIGTRLRYKNITGVVTDIQIRSGRLVDRGNEHGRWLCGYVKWSNGATGWSVLNSLARMIDTGQAELKMEASDGN